MEKQAQKTTATYSDKSKQASLFYRFIRPFARIGLRHYFRDIHISHLDNLPLDGPVILAANHPTAFLEPCILACFQKRPLHFLVRGDFFKKPAYSFLLHSLHMLPIYRKRDGGYQKVKNNFSTFEKCFEALRHQQTIMILSEGSCEHEKRLRPIQKGTARIAFGTLERHPELKLPIVPVGVNYTYAEKARETAMIDFGEPIWVNDFLEDYEEAPQRTINELTKAIGEALEKRIVIIEDPADDLFAERLLQIDRSERQIGSAEDAFLQADKSVCNTVNALTSKEKEAWTALLDPYFKALEKYDVEEKVVGQKERPNLMMPLTLGFVPALIGAVLHAPVILASLRILGLVRNIKFLSPIRWASFSMLSLLYYIILVLVGVAIGPWWYWPVLLVMALCGKWAIRYRDYYLQWKAQQRYQRLSDEDREELSKKRKPIVEKLKAQAESKPKV